MKGIFKLERIYYVLHGGILMFEFINNIIAVQFDSVFEKEISFARTFNQNTTPYLSPLPKGNLYFLAQLSETGLVSCEEAFEFTIRF